MLALQQVVHDDDGQEPERAEEQDHRVILREPSPAMGVISSGTVKSLADTLNRLSLFSRVILLRGGFEGGGDHRPWGLEQRGEEVVEVETALPCGADDAGEDLLGLRATALVRGCGQAYALQTVAPVTYRCGTRRVCQARSSGSERDTRARPHAVAPMNCVPEDSRRRSTCTGRTHSPRARADGHQTPSSTVAGRAPSPS